MKVYVQWHPGGWGEPGELEGVFASREAAEAANGGDFYWIDEVEVR